MTRPAGEVLPVNGGQLYWQESGVAAPLLLVPGTACGIPTWEGVVDELAATRRVIAYERRGFNRSTGSPARHQRVHADDAAHLLRSRHAAPAAVLGWSAGGLTALALAVEHPETVSSLVLVEPSLHMARNVTGALLAAMARANYRRLVRRDDAGAVDIVYRQVMSYRSGGSAYDRFPPPWRSQIRTAGTAIRAESAQEAAGYPSRTQLAALTCPITCVVGGLSGYQRPSRYLAKVNPRVKLVEIPDASHAVHFDQPDQFVVLLRQILDADRSTFYP